MIPVFILVSIFLVSAAGAAPNSPPAINSIAVTPENPGRYAPLTCSVSVSDAEGNLDYVDFRWYVNGALARQANKLAYGSYAAASDVFDGRKEINDYVNCEAKAYDFDRAYATANHAVRVGSIVSNSLPQISYVDITPRHPNPQQDLTCSILAMDTDDNLNHVVFEWLVNEHVVRSAAKQVTGFSDTASDTLGAGQAHDGDLVKCRANAYGTNGAHGSADSSPVMVGTVAGFSGAAYGPYYYYQPYYSPSSPYAVQKPVAVLTAGKQYVAGNETIQFSGSNSYDRYGVEITQYEFDYGDGQVSAWLPDATPYAYHAYSAAGTYYARLKVKNDEGTESDWSNPVTIYVDYYGQYYYGYGYDGYGNNDPAIDDLSLVKNPQTDYVNFECKVQAFDKDSDLEYVRFKWYFNDELLSTERDGIEGRNDEASSGINLKTNPDDVIKCEAIVYDGNHNFVSATTTAGGSAAQGAGCGLSVKRFDYITYIMEGSNGWAEMEAENTGKSGTLSMKLYVDGSLKDEYSKHLASSEKASKRFEFPLSVGTHKVMIESRMASCGSSVSRSTEISVFPLTSSGFVPAGQAGGAAADGITETSVRITPASLDIETQKGNVVSVYIESPVQAKFNISVSGLPDGWASYPKEVEVKDGKTVFIYIVPKATGNYNFTVTVKTGNRIFEQRIALYAAPGATQEGGMEGIGTGMVSALKSNWLAGLVILAVLAVLTALYFAAGSMKKKTYEDHVYGERNAPDYGPYPANSSRPIPKPPQPPQRMAKAAAATYVPKPPVVAPVAGKAGNGHVHLQAGWFTGRYTDGHYYPKRGGDF
jgi:hypothetical protein